MGAKRTGRIGTPVCVIFANPGSFYFVNSSVFGLKSLAFDANDSDVGVRSIPVRRHAVEDQSELSLIPGLERGGRKRLDIHIRLPCTNELEVLRLVLSDLMSGVPEQHLDNNPGDGAIALVRNMAVEISDLAAGQTGRLAHGEVGDGKAGGIGIEGRGNRGDLRGALAALQGEDRDGRHKYDCTGGDGQRQPVAFVLLCRGDKAEFSTRAHQRILHPPLEGRAPRVALMLNRETDSGTRGVRDFHGIFQKIPQLL